MFQTRVMSIQDISCFGKCSLTVALPIMSAMGAETCIIPTAILPEQAAMWCPPIAEESENVIYTKAGREIAVATTKAYTTQMAVMFMFALYAADKLGKLCLR